MSYQDIDFVITWVDGSDPKWQEERRRYSSDKTYNNDAQYRDWDLLRYWFRAVEAYAPWVRKIHFVTCGQVPDWLNKDNEKLVLVDHTDFIPKDYLPTFNSNSIELNFHRIPGLAEQFVYFNDDMFLNDHVDPKDFFVKGRPCETAVLNVLIPATIGDPFAYTMQNDVALMNKHFSKLAVIGRSLPKWINPRYGKANIRTLLGLFISGRFTGFKNYHLPSSMLKSVYKELWDLEYEVMDTTCRTKFREAADINQYAFSWFNICKGNFVPRSPSAGKYYTIKEESLAEICDSIENSRYKMICLNDDPDGKDFESEKEALQRAFRNKFPNKSRFEK